MSNNIELSRVACVRCFTDHKKCSRNIAGCKRCTDKGRQCEYNKDPTKYTYTDETVKFNTKENEIAQRVDVSVHTEVSSEAILVGYIPVIPLQKMRLIMSYMAAIWTNQEPGVNPTPTEMALMYSTQALAWSRKGHNLVAANLCNKAVDLISEYKPPLTLTLVTSYYLLGMYVGGRGQVFKAIEYLQQCKQALDQYTNQKKHILTTHVDFHFMMFVNLGSLLPPRFDENQSQLIAKVQRAVLARTALEKIMAQYEIPLEELEMKKLNFFIFTQGASLEHERRQHVAHSGSLPLATTITQATRSNYFPMIVPTATTSIREASYVQMECLQERRDESIITDLKQNQWAIGLIAKRSEVVMMMHRDFMIKLNEFIRNYDVVENSISGKMNLQHQ